jgi:hypothetical protein
MTNPHHFPRSEIKFQICILETSLSWHCLSGIDKGEINGMIQIVEKGCY